MKPELEGTEIIKTDNGYTLKVQKQYSNIIMSNNIILAYSNKRQELIIYDQDFSIIEKLTEVEEVKEEHQGKNVVFVTFAQYDYKNTIVLRDGKYDILRLYCNHKHKTLIQIVPVVDSKIYLLLGESHYNPFFKDSIYDSYSLFVLKLNKGETSFQFFSAYPRYINHENLIGKRFLKYQYYFYDLYTMNKMEWPAEKVSNISDKVRDIEVCYSSKQILDVKILGKYYVYIKGKLIYTYLQEDHEKILFDLQNNYTHYTKSREFCTLIIKDKLFIWSKTGEPQVVSMSRQ